MSGTAVRKAGLPQMRELRRYIVCALFGFFVAALGTNIWLFYKYIGTRPLVPNPTMVLVHPLNNHGTYHYLSATESASVTLAFNAALLAILVAFIIAPKEFIIPPPNTPR